MLITLFFAFNIAWCLDPNEEFHLKVINVVKPNVVTINRGREDGLVEKDHIKLYHLGNFISRGVVLRTEIDKAHIKLYRVMSPVKMGQDGLELVGINRSEIPSYIKLDYGLDELLALTTKSDNKKGPK